MFGDQCGYYKHALVKAGRFCDGIFAVGDYTLKEIRFLGPGLRPRRRADRVQRRAVLADHASKRRWAAGNKLRQYCKNLLRYEPDYVFTHVTRLVPSKGLWRDLRVLEHVEQQPARAQRDGGAVRAEHRGPRAAGRTTCGGWSSSTTGRSSTARACPTCPAARPSYYQGVQEFNAQSRNVKVVFVNQFGFDRQLCGQRMPADMEFMDIRKGSDAEFGQSIYEPFGIAQVEPISFGGICVFSQRVRLRGLREQGAPAGEPTPNVIVADYTELPRAGPAAGAVAEHRPAAARRRSSTRWPARWRRS